MRNSKMLKLGATKEFIAFANEINQPCDAILKQVSEVLQFIPYPYKEQIKQGKPVSKVIMDMFSVVPVGYSIDEELKESLKLDGFVMVDCDIKLEDKYFFFAYDATKEAKANLNCVYVIIDKDGATLICNRSIGKKEVDNVKKLTEDFEDKILYDYDYEFEFDEEYPSISLRIQAETLGELPNVRQLSKLFDRVEKRASTLS